MPHMMRCLLICFLFCLLKATAGAVEIPLTVEEPAGIERTQAPVTGGVCFERGTMKVDQPLSLWDGQRVVPAQVTPLVVDRDGTMRWGLLDFKADLKAKEKKTFILKSIPAAARAPSRLETKDAPDAITINTGAIELNISKTKPFVLFDSVKAAGREIARGSAVDFVEGTTNLRRAAGVPRQVTLEYSGPYRVTVRVDGEYDGEGESKLKYITRITAWAGRSDVRVHHILANSNSKRVYYANVKSATLGVSHTLGADAEGLAGGGAIAGKLSDGPAWLHIGLLRDRSDTAAGATLASASGGAWKGNTSGGWIAARGGGRTIWVCDRDFNGDPPRKLSADAKTITAEYISDKFKDAPRQEPFAADSLWLYDLTHRRCELWIDFASPAESAAAMDQAAAAARGRLLAFASPEWYSKCDAMGVGPFGSLEDEEACYKKWGWAYTDKQVPHSAHDPNAFVRWEDNHYESESDSVEGLLLMALRTGQRGFFDQGEAWAKYHMDLQAWRTDGWEWQDGAIWFPQGGPLGSRRLRGAPNVKYATYSRGAPFEKDLWRASVAKACYCHFYGAGLVDYFLLTGERDALEAAIDDVEIKNSEMRKHKIAVPGKMTIHDTRGFGRGFYVSVRVLEADPRNTLVYDLVTTLAQVLWNDPNLDERGFAPSDVGSGFNAQKEIGPKLRAIMEQRKLTVDGREIVRDGNGQSWPITSLGGTWQHAYIGAAAERCWRVLGDENMADFTIGFGRFCAKYMISDKCHQTWYYAYMDVPERGQMFDPWKYEEPHASTKDGEGCTHSGYYTQFFPAAMAQAYSLTGDAALLDRSKEFWAYGSRRRYMSKALLADMQHAGDFAHHAPPKDDTVLSTARLFGETMHPHSGVAPAAIKDLAVRRAGDKIEIRFTAPAGKLARYQVKCAELPIVPYAQWDPVKDKGQKRNLWRAWNVDGEPTPTAGKVEKFVVNANPAAKFFVVLSYDEEGDQSPISNVAALE